MNGFDDHLDNYGDPGAGYADADANDAPCERCGADIAQHLPHVGLLSRCRHCHGILRTPRRGTSRLYATEPANKVATEIPRMLPCFRCGRQCVYITPECEGAVLLEPAALDNKGELDALLAGRVTYDLGEHYCARRTFADITSRPAEMYNNVHATHSCDRELGDNIRFAIPTGLIYDGPIPF